MIIGEDHLNGCSEKIFKLVDQLVLKYETIYIESGFRSKTANIDAGGAPKSSHLTGDAIDFRVKNVNIIKIGSWVLDNIKYVKGFGFNFHTNVIHLDVRNVKTNVYWSYDEFGKAV